EPLVTLIVEANWAAGSQQRMYDMLLDPPVFLPGGPRPAAVQPQAPPQTVTAGPVTRPAPQPSPQPVPQQSARTASQPPQTPAPQTTTPAAPPRTAAPPPPAPRAASTAPPAGSYGPVQRSETLWGIAERYRPSGVSMNQMMLAIFEANPQAFAGNMNLLQAGASLRIPSDAEVRGRTAAEATAEVQR